MITKADRPKLVFDDLRQEWQLITPVILSNQQLALAVQHCKGVYLKRMAGEIGERRKRIQNAVSLLSVASVKQFMVGNGEKILYHSDKL